MKLLIVARPFVFHGGVETATAGLVRALVEHGYDVHLLTPAGRASLPGVTQHRLVLPPLPATARVVAQALAVRRVAQRGGWDVIQSHERTLGQDIYRAGEGCHRGYLAAVGARARGIYHRVMLTLERRIFTTTPRIVAIARAGKAEIERLYGVPAERIDVVYNGVDLERFHPRHRATLGRAARTEAAVPPDAPLALFAGSGFERKGLTTALEAIALYRPARWLLVVGKGSRGRHEALARRLGIADRVVWLGPRRDIERWYAAADVVVLPTRYEPFGNVHLEALASGVPVVTSTRAGGAEVIEEGKNGAVVDPRDAQAVAEALERFRAGDRGISEAARRSAEPFTYRAQVAGLARIYRGQTGEKARLPLRNR
jgi:UDP-glucose:(heptosyl)LPS alpha-1,3-glucosyltransferase